MRKEMAAVEDTQVNRLAILAATRVGLHELRKTAVAGSRLVTWTYVGVGAVLVLLSGFGNDKGLLAAAGMVTMIMAAAVYMGQRQDRSCCPEIEECEKGLSALVGNDGSLTEADGTSVAATALDVMERSQEWSKALLRDYGTHLAWVLVTAAVLTAASGMANGGWQMVALQISAAYLALSAVASDLRSVRTLWKWRKAVRSAQEMERSVFAGVLSPNAPSEMYDAKVVARFLEKLERKGDTSQRTRLQMAVGVEQVVFVRHLDLLVSGGFIAIRKENGAETVLLTVKGGEQYAALLALLEKALHIDY